MGFNLFKLLGSEKQAETGFNVKEMFKASREAIERFANEHQGETFYAFSIDAGMLCLNSEEEFNKTLNSYKENFPDSYNDAQAVNNLKYNTGDWEYQGFFDLDDGYDSDLYEDHYNVPLENSDLEEEELEELIQNTPYHKAMSELLDKLVKSKVFDKLNMSPDFKVFLSEHEY